MAVFMNSFGFNKSLPARFGHIGTTNAEPQPLKSQSLINAKTPRFNALSSSNGENLTIDEKPQSQPESPPPDPPPKKSSPLTARERLRAARVLSRYTETSPKKTTISKPELGSQLRDALQETGKKGKRQSGLPEAPTNLFDDSKRGMPKPGWTFNFPGGMDVLFILISFVLITSVMLGTTYVVWKVGAIHFNEY